eukprot:COSAG02_NODE_8815_length_2434_cov_2.682227_3_plen_121_part_00
MGSACAIVVFSFIPCVFVLKLKCILYSVLRTSLECVLVVRLRSSNVTRSVNEYTNFVVRAVSVLRLLDLWSYVVRERCNRGRSRYRPIYRPIMAVANTARGIAGGAKQTAHGTEGTGRPR